MSCESAPRIGFCGSVLPNHVYHIAGSSRSIFGCSDVPVPFRFLRAQRGRKSIRLVSRRGRVLVRRHDQGLA